MFSSQRLILPICIVLIVALLRKKGTRRRRLPPGPSPVPLLGNVFGIDTQHPWRTYARWRKEYGDIIYTRLLTQDVIIINSEEVAQDLLNLRSHIYSSRPESVISMTKFMGVDFSSVFLPYGDRWRLHRRFFHQAFHSNAASTFHPVQLRKARELIMRLASTPHNFREHVHLLSASLVTSVMYDYEAAGADDPILVQLQRATDIAVDVLRPEVTAILAAFPFLKYIPEWFPGASFKRNALISRRTVPEWVDVPFEYVKQNMAAGTAAPSMLFDALSRLQDQEKTEEDVAFLEKEAKEACAGAFGAAAETTNSTLLIFLLVMMLYPDVQTRAQAEIDSVIGKGLPRLPHWEDRSSLPYVEAVVKETLRWHPAVPLGIPHATVDDDIYKGYHIPKGATVAVNAWAISRDPARFPEPEKFKPERFLSGNTGDPVGEISFAFGFGRRACVGRHIAEGSLWISIVSLLAVFRFEASPSWNPGPDGINVKWAPGVSTRPEDLPCKIKPRHEDLTPEKLGQLISL